MLYSIYDLLKQRADELEMSETELYAYFQKKGFRKRSLDAFRKSAVMPSTSQKISIMEFLDISELEYELALGNVPVEYQECYLKNVHKIASMLKKKNEERSQEEKLFPCFRTMNGNLYHADCMELLRNMGSETVDMIFCDPPFNLKKNYENGFFDDVSATEYIRWCETWINDCVRVLKDGGSFFLYNLPRWNSLLANYIRTKLTIRSWIVLNMRNYPISTRLNPTHYSLLYCCKGVKPTTFNTQRIPIETCPSCGKELKNYGGHRRDLNPGGITLSEVWEDISPVKHKDNKHRGANELSVKFMDRVISMSTNKGDIVLDLFAGTGTTLAVAELLNRKWIGCEIGCCEEIITRLENPQRDHRNLDAVEKNVLFTSKALARRKKRDLWLKPTDKKPSGHPKKLRKDNDLR